MLALVAIIAALSFVAICLGTMWLDERGKRLAAESKARHADCAADILGESLALKSQQANDLKTEVVALRAENERLWLRNFQLSRENDVMRAVENDVARRAS